MSDLVLGVVLHPLNAGLQKMLIIFVCKYICLAVWKITAWDGRTDRFYIQNLVQVGIWVAPLHPSPKGDATAPCAMQLFMPLPPT